MNAICIIVTYTITSWYWYTPPTALKCLLIGYDASWLGWKKWTCVHFCRSQIRSRITIL